MELGLIDGEIVYGDGTILKAWCNTFKKMYPYEIDYLKRFLKSNAKNDELWMKLKKYFINEDDDDALKEELQDLLNEFQYNLNSSGIYLLKNSLISSKNFEKVLERIELMEANIHGENSIIIIDPESRHMVNKKGKMGLNYNYQTITDNKYGFRIVHYITNNPNDEKEVKRLVDMTGERLKTDEFILCLDNGYWVRCTSVCRCRAAWQPPPQIHGRCATQGGGHKSADSGRPPAASVSATAASVRRPPDNTYL